MEENGRTFYKAAAANPYGLDEGLLAGRAITVGTARNVNPNYANDAVLDTRNALVLHREVVRELFLKANTPDALAQGNWSVPLSFDPKDSSVVLLECIVNNTKVVQINGISPEVLSTISISSPYPGETTVSVHKANSAYGQFSVAYIYVSDLYAPEKGTNWGVGIYYAEPLVVDRVEKKMGYGEKLFGPVTGTFGGFPFVKGADFVYCAGTKSGARDLTLDNLTLAGTIVFMMD